MLKTIQRSQINGISLYFLISKFILLLQAAPVNIVVGSHVWVEDPDLAWVDGEVSQINGQEVHVHTIDGKSVCFSQLIVKCIQK